MVHRFIINKITPFLLKSYLDKIIVSQNKAKKILSVSILNHIKRIKNINNYNLEKSNLLLIGPSGTGKTLLLETLSDILSLPLSISDATNLTEAGYVGEDVETILQKLLYKTNFDINSTQKGIIFLDEIDKISKKNFNISITRDVSGEGVQQSLLKLIEGTIASVPLTGIRKHPLQECISIDTTNILFICAGAFNGIDNIIMNRLNIKKKVFLGFSLNNNYHLKKKNILSKLEPQDLIRFGLIPELVGRLPIIINFHKLNIKSLIKILINPVNSLLKQYIYLFHLDNINLNFTYKSIVTIAKLAFKKNIGVRGLKNIIENILLNPMFYINHKKIKNINITNKVIKRIYKLK